MVIIIGIIISSNYIWNIEVSRKCKYIIQEIIQILDASGLTIGTSKNDIDTNTVINKIRLSRDDVAWIGITVKGTNAIVKVKEADKAPKYLDENKYCNIIADKTRNDNKNKCTKWNGNSKARRYS